MSVARVMFLDKGKRERSFFLFPHGRHLCPNLDRMGETAWTELQKGVWTSAREAVTKLIVFMLGISEGMQDVCWFVSTFFPKAFFGWIHLQWQHWRANQTDDHVTLICANTEVKSSSWSLHLKLENFILLGWNSSPGIINCKKELKKNNSSLTFSIKLMFAKVFILFQDIPDLWQIIFTKLKRNLPPGKKPFSLWMIHRHRCERLYQTCGQLNKHEAVFEKLRFTFSRTNKIPPTFCRGG